MPLIRAKGVRRLLMNQTLAERAEALILNQIQQLRALFPAYLMESLHRSFVRGRGKSVIDAPFDMRRNRPLTVAGLED